MKYTGDVVRRDTKKVVFHTTVEVDITDDKEEWESDRSALHEIELQFLNECIGDDSIFWDSGFLFVGEETMRELAVAYDCDGCDECYLYKCCDEHNYCGEAFRMDSYLVKLSNSQRWEEVI